MRHSVMYKSDLPDFEGSYLFHLDDGTIVRQTIFINDDDEPYNLPADIEHIVAWEDLPTFDLENVYGPQNADKLKDHIGERILVADEISKLKSKLNYLYDEGIDNSSLLKDIMDETYTARFKIVDGSHYVLAYLLPQPSELKVSDLDVGDIIQPKDNKKRKYMILGKNEDVKSICIYDRILKEDDLVNWKKVKI